MKIYGLLGRNIGYSFSKGYFEKKFKKEGLHCQYHNFDLPNLGDLKTILADQTIQGLNVTIPYKLEVMPFLTELDETAAAIGAVNVIKINKNRALKGFNSDYYGFLNSLKPLLSKNVEDALILGTGGASKAVAHALTTLGIKFKYVSRTKRPGQLTYEVLSKEIVSKNKLIINCTPLGTHPNTEQCPDIPYEHLDEQHILYDLIYNPAETLFMKKGKTQGAKTTNGLQMLVLQAEKAWEIWNT